MENCEQKDEETVEENGILDPRIQVELEQLNTCTEEINKLEIELDEANATFRLLLNESTRRLKLLSKKLGSCIERARPYYDAIAIAKEAQIKCQKAAQNYHKANEFHAAAKETVALAEKQFLSNQHEWQFDNAWQEMLNKATIRVMDAETQKAADGREHQMRANEFTVAEQKNGQNTLQAIICICGVQLLEEQLRRHIIKSRPYFEEKDICQDQLNTQKERIEYLQRNITQAKYAYAQSLKKLESISEEIHQKRRRSYQSIQDDEEIPHGPREPGVGAERNSLSDPLPDINMELNRCDVRSMDGLSTATQSDYEDDNINDLETKFAQLRTVDGCNVEVWNQETAHSNTSPGGNVVESFQHMNKT